MGAPLAGTVRTRTAGRLSRCSAIRATREVFPRTSSMRSSGSPAIPSPSWRQPGRIGPLAEASGTWGYLRRSVSKSTVGRWLKRAALKPYRVRRWLHSPDPEFRLKVRRVVRLVSAAAPVTILGDGHGALRPRARPGADHDAGVQPGEQRIWPRRLSERSNATT